MEAESKVESWEILQPTHLKSLIVSFRSGLKLDSWYVLRIIEKLGSFLRMRQQKNVIPRHSRCGTWDPSSLKVLNVQPQLQWWRPHVSNLSYNGDVTTWVKNSRTGIKQQWNNNKNKQKVVTTCLSRVVCLCFGRLASPPRRLWNQVVGSWRSRKMYSASYPVVTLAILSSKYPFILSISCNFISINCHIIDYIFSKIFAFHSVT